MTVPCHHIAAKNNGVTKEEMAEILPHVAFYTGWPIVWAVFRVAVEVYGAEEDIESRFFTDEAGKKAEMQRKS